MGTCQAKREGSDKTPEEQAESLEQSEAELPGEPVHLNVYDLMIMNYTINRLGIGIYHTGVEVFGREYSYAGHYHTETTGLKDSLPRDTSWLHDAIWRERIYIGKTLLTREQVKREFELLKTQYLGPSYNVLDRNCNHFTEHFVKILTSKELPSYVNRIMKVATKVRVCLPGMFTNDLRDQQAPPEYENHKYAVPQPRDVAQTPGAPSIPNLNAGAPMNSYLINEAVEHRDGARATAQTGAATGKQAPGATIDAGSAVVAHNSSSNATAVKAS